MTDNRHSFAKFFYYFRKQGKWQFQINFLKNSNNWRISMQNTHLVLCICNSNLVLEIRNNFPQVGILILNNFAGIDKKICFFFFFWLDLLWISLSQKSVVGMAYSPFFPLWRLIQNYLHCEDCKCIRSVMEPITYWGSLFIYLFICEGCYISVGHWNPLAS
jgi:hypothetical protein